MNKRLAYLTGVSLALGLFCAPAAAKFVTFQVPEAPTTIPKVIANSGDVIGTFVDQSAVQHGFLRAPDGTITTIDVPGGASTEPTAINDDGTIVGQYTLTNKKFAGFIRAPDGHITVFQAPHASRNTRPVSINNRGWVAGAGMNSSGGSRPFGFIEKPSGHFTIFGVNLAVHCANTSNTAAGQIVDQSGTHGFVRTPDGTLTQFDPSGATYTDVVAINDAGTSVGFSQITLSTYVGLARAADGTISTFLGDADAVNTYAWGINKGGIIVGSYDNGDGSGGGYVRATDGTITTFNVQGSPDTQPTSINNKGQIVGAVQLNGVLMGFIGKP